MAFHQIHRQPLRRRAIGKNEMSEAGQLAYACQNQTDYEKMREIGLSGVKNVNKELIRQNFMDTRVRGLRIKGNTHDSKNEDFLNIREINCMPKDHRIAMPDIGNGQDRYRMEYERFTKPSRSFELFNSQKSMIGEINKHIDIINDNQINGHSKLIKLEKSKQYMRGTKKRDGEISMAKIEKHQLKNGTKLISNQLKKKQLPEYLTNQFQLQSRGKGVAERHNQISNVKKNTIIYSKFLNN
jgi:hypothetical protein